MTTPPHINPPRLLVSVRTVAEARAAIEGGCDILDVKEPAHGSLGMAEPETIRRIADLPDTAGHPELPVSAALGELLDWTSAGEESAGLPGLPETLRFVKLGLAGLRSSDDWPHRWLRVREQIEQTAGRRLNWIGVVYADAERAGAPAPAEIVRTAIETRCTGVLFDTFRKDGRSLFEWIDTATLISMVQQIRTAGLITALAGSLASQHATQIIATGADIVAIRSAACRGQVRTAEISAAAIREFRQQLVTAEQSIRGT